jgi:hypothetical protein
VRDDVFHLVSPQHQNGGNMQSDAITVFISLPNIVNNWHSPAKKAMNL